MGQACCRNIFPEDKKLTLETKGGTTIETLTDGERDSYRESVYVKSTQKLNNNMKDIFISDVKQTNQTTPNVQNENTQISQTVTTNKPIDNEKEKEEKNNDEESTKIANTNPFLLNSDNKTKHEPKIIIDELNNVDEPSKVDDDESKVKSNNTDQQQHEEHDHEHIHHHIKDRHYSETIFPTNPEEIKKAEEIVKQEELDHIKKEQEEKQSRLRLLEESVAEAKKEILEKVAFNFELKGLDDAIHNGVQFVIEVFFSISR